MAWYNGVLRGEEIKFEAQISTSREEWGLETVVDIGRVIGEDGQEIGITGKENDDLEQQAMERCAEAAEWCD